MDQLRDMAHNMSSLAADAIEAIEFHTGLPPLVLFTVIALLLGAYYLISGILAPSQIGAVPPASLAAMAEDEAEEEMEAAAAAAAAEAVHLGDHVSLLELSKYDGRDSGKPLLVAIKGTIYDVSAARDFYGPGEPYAAFAGRDASRALAKMSFDDSDLCGNLSGLSSRQLQILQDWEAKFAAKYRKAGTLKRKEGSDDKMDEEPMVDDSSIGMEMGGDHKKVNKVADKVADEDESRDFMSGDKDDDKKSKVNPKDDFDDEKSKTDSKDDHGDEKKSKINPKDGFGDEKKPKINLKDGLGDEKKSKINRKDGFGDNKKLKTDPRDEFGDEKTGTKHGLDDGTTVTSESGVRDRCGEDCFNSSSAA